MKGIIWIEVLRTAIGYEEIKTQQQLAILLGVHRREVSRWLNGRSRIPLEHALDIERLTKGLVKAEDLAPYAREKMQFYKKYLLSSC